MNVETLLARAEKALAGAQLPYDGAFYEDAVSRSYYAMFYAAEALLLARRHSASTHKGVIMQLNRHLVKKGHLAERYGKMLSRGAAKRQLADYTGDFVISEEEAAEVLRDARQFIDEARRLTNER